MRATVAAIAAVAACAPAAAPLAPGETPPSSPVGAARGAVASRGAIGYDVAFVGARLHLTVELGVAFELVARRVDDRRLVEIGRVELGPPDWDITAVAAPAAGPRVWVSSLDGTVREIDLSNLRVARTWRVGQAVTAAAVSGDGRLLAYGTDRGVVCLRRTRDGALLQCMRAHRSRISALAVGGGDAGLALWSATWTGEVARFALPSLARRGATEVSGAVNDLAARDGRVAVAVSSEPASGDRRRRGLAGSVVVIDLDAQRRWSCRGHGGPVSAVTWSSALVVSGSWDRTIRGWSVGGDDCRQRWRVEPGGHQITALAADPRGRHLAVSLWVTDLEQPTSVLLRLLYPRP